MTRWRTSDGSAYEVRTGGHGPAVLLIHGFTGRATDWTPFLGVIRAAGWRTIVVDLLGHGRSDAPLDPARHAIERQAADLADLLRQLDAAPAVVVGYSMGARIALRLAIAAPTSVRGLILESPSAGLTEPPERAKRAAADATLADELEHDGVAAFMDRWEAQPLFAREQELPAPVRSRIQRDRRRNRASGLAASLRGGGQGVMEPLVSRLKTVRCPVVLVAGSLDGTGVQRAATIARSVPTVRLLILPGRGHAPHREDPDRFARLILDQLTAWSAP